MEEMIEDGLDEKFKFNVWKDILTEFGKERTLFAGVLFIHLLMGFFDVGTTFITKYIIDSLILKENSSLIGFFSLLSIGLTLCFFALIFLAIWLCGKMEENILHNLRVRIFKKYQMLSLSFYDTHAVGHLMARITSDIEKIGEVMAWGFSELMWQVIVLFFTIIAMFMLNGALTLIILVVTPIIMFVAWKMNKVILRRNRLVSKLNSQMISTYDENIKGLLTAKTLNREAINDEDFSNLSLEMRRASIRATRTMVFMPFVIAGISSIGTFFVNIGGANYVMQNVITIGTLVSFSALLAKLMEPIAWFAELFAWVVSAQASVERVIAVFKEKVEIADSESAKKNYGNEALKNRIIKGDIKFENVCFEYKKGERVLENFNLTVAAGESVALVGATGAGKSTIVNLFCHFYEQTSGKITIGGMDYKDVPQKWIHDNLGYVLQAPYLFTGSILENIRYGNLKASDEEIIEALRLVGAAPFIESLKDGYHTQLGENGAILSTGQKQLLSLARILVRNPAFFVLDEATSYIDTQTEQIVQKAIKFTLKGRTSFVIAHRLSTIRDADKIVVIKKGKILESGNHTELLNKKGAYYEFYKKQFIEDGERSV